MFFHLEIETDNAGMQTAEDVAVALEKAAKRLRDGADSGAILDVNGNKVGKWSAALPCCDGRDGDHEKGCPLRYEIGD